jgi:hypothetical protein
VSILFLAPSCSFVDTDRVLGPNVDAMGRRVDDRAPFLGQAVGVPFAKGMIKPPFAGRGIAAMQNFPPCSPNKVRWFVLTREPVYWWPWEVIAIDCPFAYFDSIASAYIGQSSDTQE